jgi:OOP family OmpA-OmpF porin
VIRAGAVAAAFTAVGSSSLGPSLSDDKRMDIAMRTAKVVADELVKHGVVPDTIVISGMGDDNPVKPTADGVIEPHTRRVELRIR